MGSIQQSDGRAPLVDHPERRNVAVRADTIPHLVRECLVLDEKLDRFCGQPATWWAGRLPCCDDCRTYLLANDWPFGMHRIETVGVAS